MSEETESPQYVSIGTSNGMSITMKRETFSTALIALLIFVGFLIIVVIIVTVLLIRENTVIKPIHKKKNKTPSVSDSYLKIGLPQNLTVSIIDTKDSNSEIDCSYDCNRDRDCSGFFFEKNQCTLFTDDLTIQDDRYHQNSYVYVKRKEKVHFNNKIFLGKFGLPKDFWNKREDTNYSQLDVGVVTKLNFVPNYIKMDKNYIGIYTKYKFSKDHLQLIISRDTTYIHYPGTRLEVPWTDSNEIYVVYIENE